jgi:hypothetical protein
MREAKGLEGKVELPIERERVGADQGGERDSWDAL